MSTTTLTPAAELPRLDWPFLLAAVLGTAVLVALHGLLVLVLLPASPASDPELQATTRESPLPELKRIDKEFWGEAWPGENVPVGYLPQEPQLDPSKTVRPTSTAS